MTFSPGNIPPSVPLPPRILAPQSPLGYDPLVQPSPDLRPDLTLCQIVTLEALAPFRVAAPEKNPANLAYLVDSGLSNFDIHLEVAQSPSFLSSLLPGTNRHQVPPRAHAPLPQQLQVHVLVGEAAGPPQLPSHLPHPPQVVQHTVTGCNLRPGDLLGSGTISGPDGQMGSLIELSSNGKNAVTLANGEKRSFIEDGDTVRPPPLPHPSPLVDHPARLGSR